MIQIEIRSNNYIVTLNTPLKQPIRSSRISPYFYKPMELLCCAMGSCFGGELVTLCKTHNINPKSFESISITLDDTVIKYIIQKPKDMSTQTLEDIKYIAVSCPVARLLKTPPEVQFIDNSVDTSTLLSKKIKSCCGG